MKGLHKVIVQNNRLHYEFDIKRNITIIQGNSATGKTTLTDNYYVLITRENLYNLPYSVEEIYGIRTSGRHGTLKQSYGILSGV